MWGPDPDSCSSLWDPGLWEPRPESNEFSAGMSSHSMTTLSSRSLTEPAVLLEALFCRLFEWNFLFNFNIVVRFRWRVDFKKCRIYFKILLQKTSSSSSWLKSTCKSWLYPVISFCSAPSRSLQLLILCMSSSSSTNKESMPKRLAFPCFATTC